MKKKTGRPLVDAPSVSGDSERRGAERSEAPRSGEASETDPVVVPDPQVFAKPTRRRFTTEFKLEVLREADRCTEPGEVGALLRRHGLYSSHLVVWRRDRDLGARDGLSKKRGRKPAERNPLAPRLAQLERENRVLQSQLKKAELIIDIQKNHQVRPDHLLDEKLPHGLSSAAREEWPSAYW